MNVEIGTEATQFPEKKCINGVFLAVKELNATDGRELEHGFVDRYRFIDS
jgi:hypothetical protein